MQVTQRQRDPGQVAPLAGQTVLGQPRAGKPVFGRHGGQLGQVEVDERVRRFHRGVEPQHPVDAVVRESEPDRPRRGDQKLADDAPDIERTQPVPEVAVGPAVLPHPTGDRDEPAVRLMQSNFRDAYWTLAQLVVHHTSNGCNLQSGDLFGSGTQSGPDVGQGGSLLELTHGGKQPIMLPDGETRTFLEDGDTVTLRGFCERAGQRRIGFGDCAATVIAARGMSSTL